MPESPYWLLSKNRTAAAGRSLAWLRGYPSSDSASVTDELDRLEESVREDMRNVRSYRDLFATPGNRKGLLIVQMLALIQRMSGCTLAMFSAGLWFYLNSKTTIDVSNCHWIPFASFVVYGIFFCFGLGPIASTVQGEYFPQSIKGLASGVTSLVLAATSFVMNKIYHSIALTWGMHLNYFIFAGASLVGAIFVVTVVIETKGKTFQEIQEKLNSGARRPEARYSKAPVQEL
ncbi:unnamed protein product [Nesidiocoris tenuis]|uniref:Major facilitator superfamily (MFS) profile domain-containing protein n=1 Tax=Nesidiocoris tenuis TaxID=355587 RepID=A0A6H5G7R1_9HEMI|nr:unnamed protein product [Nesidiocoris tenuis]